MSLEREVWALLCMLWLFYVTICCSSKIPHLQFFSTHWEFKWLHSSILCGAKNLATLKPCHGRVIKVFPSHHCSSNVTISIHFSAGCKNNYYLLPIVSEMGGIDGTNLYFNILKPFILVRLSLDVVGLLSANTGKNPPISWLEPGTPLFQALCANH